VLDRNFMNLAPFGRAVELLSRWA